MVVSNKNIDFLKESYIFFKNHNMNFTLNMYVSSLNKNDDALSLKPDYTIKKLIELYNYWANDDKCNINITYYERILNFLYNHKKTVCCNTSCLGKWIAIRHNGEITPCNRFFPSKYSYGNILQYKKLSDAFDSSGFITLTKEAINRREKCISCSAFDLCAGGCNNVAYNENGIENNGGDSCTIFRSVYNYIKKDYTERCINKNFFKNNKIIKFIK